MKRPLSMMMAIALALGLSPAASLFQPQFAHAASTQSMFRLYNPNSGEHFYTADAGERDSLQGAGWNYEGIEWTAPVSSNTPVYRLYSGTDHHYTMSAAERDALVAAGWSDEGIGWCSDDAQGVPLYRQFNPNVDPTAPFNNSGSHNYTTSEAEHWALVAIGWIAENVGWYGVRPGSSSGGSTSTTRPSQPTNPDNTGGSTSGGNTGSSSGGSTGGTTTNKPAAPTYSSGSISYTEISATYSVPGAYTRMEWELYQNGSRVSTKSATTNKVTFSGLKSGTKYECRARVLSNGVYSDWSSFHSETTMASSSGSSTSSQAQYDYEMRVLNPQGLYDNSDIVLYVKTKNPGTNFSVHCDTSKMTDVLASSYDDIRTKSGSSGNMLTLANGTGYIMTVQLVSPGTHTLYVDEYGKSSNGSTNYYDEHRAGKPLTITVADYDKAKDEWMDRMIAKYCDSRMTKLEKMAALCTAFEGGSDAGLLSSNMGAPSQSVGNKQLKKRFPNAQCYKDASLFTYNLNVDLAADTAPFFVNYHWDSAVSPSCLYDFAKKLGFTNVENLYGKYKRGTTEWSRYHWYVEITEGGTKYLFGACPSQSTGKVDTSAIKYLDLS